MDSGSVKESLQGIADIYEVAFNRVTKITNQSEAQFKLDQTEDSFKVFSDPQFMVLLQEFFAKKGLAFGTDSNLENIFIMTQERYNEMIGSNDVKRVVKELDVKE